jgi:hypothetical protein
MFDQLNEDLNQENIDEDSLDYHHPMISESNVQETNECIPQSTTLYSEQLTLRD